MSDNNAHPGVRSLLAKFENSPSSVTSPPSRGRSPVSSDTPGSSRQLSKVRASFVTVDGVVQSNPGSPLRKTSGRSDSPGMFGPKINEQDVEARRQSLASPTPGSLNDGQKGVLDQLVSPVLPVPTSVPTTQSKTVPAVDSKGPVKTEMSAAAPTSTSASAVAPASGTSEQPAQKTVTKRPSTINATRNNIPNTKPTSSVASAAKQPANTSTKPASSREIAKERANTLANKPSRASLNPATKSVSRTVRGSTPSQEPLRTSPPNSAKSHTRSPTRPVRLPASMTAPTQASASRLGNAAPPTGRTTTTASTLTRKPSSLKSAAGAGQTRPTAGSTAGVRRQSSRSSLPPQPAQERPSSRTSDAGPKPATEGFLARMMRPTASSASKTHDRPEPKAPQKSTTTKPPRASMGRAPERSAQQPKAKPAALRPQTEKSQAANKEPLPKKEKEEVRIPQPEPESEKENVEESTPVIPEEPEVAESKDAVIETPKTETTANTTQGGKLAEESKQEVVSESVMESVSEPVESTTVNPSTETPLEQGPQAIAKEVMEAPIEAPVEIQSKDGQAPTEASVEEPAEDPMESPEEVSQTPDGSTPANELAAVEEDITPEELEVLEVSQTAEIPAVVSNDKVAEPSTKSEEPTVSAEKPAAEAKQNVDDIDFVSLALN
ncbi:hypothetical protein N7494_010999 [Penicillium frequentans]|uniref:Mucin-7 n=1 Tax=Penicillium frequentans TaxID=3151616 RepID=A0AAD6CIY7_9EURO|nr:hypothetical protein N7494_010999 [Penicillium glabrum]